MVGRMCVCVNSVVLGVVFDEKTDAARQYAGMGDTHTHTHRSGLM